MTRRKGDDDRLDALRKIECAEHGSEPWRGDVVCAIDAGGCGRLYQTRDDQTPHFAPFICPCGKQLMPKPTSRDDEGEVLVLMRVAAHGVSNDWTARAVCSHCFEENADAEANERLDSREFARAIVAKVTPAKSMLDIFMSNPALVTRVADVTEKVVDHIGKATAEAAANERARMLAEIKSDARGVEVKIGDHVSVSVVRNFVSSKHGGSGDPVFLQPTEPLTRELALQLAAIFALASLDLDRQVS